MPAPNQWNFYVFLQLIQQLQVQTMLEIIWSWRLVDQHFHLHILKPLLLILFINRPGSKLGRNLQACIVAIRYDQLIVNVGEAVLSSNSNCLWGLVGVPFFDVEYNVFCIRSYMSLKHTRFDILWMKGEVQLDSWSHVGEEGVKEIWCISFLVVLEKTR